MISANNSTTPVTQPPHDDQIEDCPICLESESSQAPQLDFCAYPHKACANCVKRLAEQAIRSNASLLCMICREPINPEVALQSAFKVLRSINTLLTDHKISDMLSTHWMLYAREIGIDQTIELEGQEFTKRDCLIQAAKTKPTHIDAWAELGVSLTEGERVVIRGKSYDKARCFVKAASVARTALA